MEKRTTLEAQAAAVAERMEALGLDPQQSLPLNNGSRRTAEKRALLQAIRDAAAKAGREPPFTANF
ncbi:hypothetical protein STAQ_20680 [Allostella sp. ATCC 35155]|nr:hypothetical protein STAQ_20680 [Stella sp. ATCC 35155]